MPIGMSSGTSGKGKFGMFFPRTTYQSEIIYLDDKLVISATPRINLLADAGYAIALSNNGGNDWENATNYTKHNFITSGKRLMIRIIAKAGGGTIIGCGYADDGKTYIPAIKVDYTIA